MTSLKKINFIALPVIMLLVMVSLTFSCKKDEPAPLTLLVKVHHNGTPLSNVHVFTVPFTVDALTDEYGLAKIEGISSGEYLVYAESGDQTGNAIIIMNDGDVKNVSVNISYTGPIIFLPEISLVLPDPYCASAPGDTVIFRVKVSNFKEGSQITWNSDLDGHLDSTPITAEGFSDFATSLLKEGKHVITVKAIGSKGYSTIKVIHIYIDGSLKVYLYPPEILGSSVLLRWSKYQGDDFGFYQVSCRYSTKPDEPFIDTISTSFNLGPGDTSIVFYLPWSYYTAQFYILTGNRSGAFISSNTREISHYVGMCFDGIPVQMLQHPQNNWVYLVFADRTIIYDYQNKHIISSTDIGSTSKFSDLGDNGSGLELYLAKQSSINILDGSTLALKRVIPFPQEILSVVSSGLGFLICSQVSAAPDVKPVQVYSLSQQSVIAEGGDPYDANYMKKVPGRNVLIAYTLNGNDSKLDYFEYNSSGSITLHNSVDIASGGFSVEVMEMSPNGEYFCVGNYDGCFRQTNQDMTSVAYLEDSDPVSDFAFDDTGNIVWRCSYNSSVINEYHYPSGSVTGGRHVYGIPVHMVYRNNSCIVVTRTNVYLQSCVEVVPVGAK